MRLCTDSSELLLLANQRPSAVRQKPLPAFEASDPSGEVHTTAPPELVIPSKPKIDFFRGDLGGVMLKQTPPLVPGGNTTPLEMTMSFLLPWYPRLWQDVILRAHAERGYTHFLLDRWQADKAGLNDAQFVSLIAYVQSWGFFTPIWVTSANDDRSHGWQSVRARVLSFFSAIPRAVAERCLFLPGEELNNGCPPGPDGADSIIASVCNFANVIGAPAWLHLTANYPDYPPNPRTDASAVVWWQQWIGKLRGLCWQGNQNDSAGLQGARMYDARRILHRANPSFKLVAFELLATNQLYGRATEEQGCLRGLEMVYCPQGETIQMVWGFGNGARYPDGTAI
jgi:hypothetical protein